MIEMKNYASFSLLFLFGFSTVSGIDIHAITPITCVCCIFYTCVGGIKAVIYTDVVQSLMMFGAMFLVIIKGTLDVGGLGIVIDRNINSGRIEGPEYVNCY
jgi:solute carrier family 5 (sodium-coupled monocarboxylate transporter), member 8/12